MNDLFLMIFLVPFPLASRLECVIRVNAPLTLSVRIWSTAGYPQSRLGGVKFFVTLDGMGRRRPQPRVNPGSTGHSPQAAAALTTPASAKTPGAS